VAADGELRAQETAVTFPNQVGGLERDVRVLLHVQEVR
jgi:hypothetical protein